MTSFRMRLSPALCLLALVCCSSPQQGGAGEQGTWESLKAGAGPGAGLQLATAFDGQGVLLWGGLGGCTVNGVCGDGARFDVAARSWSPLSSLKAPAARTLHTAVWTGQRMLVWGGVGCGERPQLPCGDGAAYAPDTDTWSALPTQGAPSARGWHTAAWTGQGMLVWGGEEPQQARVLGDGARYDVETGTWTPLSGTGAPVARRYHSAVWTGQEWLVWGGSGGAAVDVALRDGAAYSPATDTWRPLASAGAPEARWAHTAVWTGTEMLVFGGLGCGGDGPRYCEGGARYDPRRDAWSPLSTKGAPSPRTGHVAVWTGTRMLVWGGAAAKCGNGGSGACADGAVYDPASDTWTPLRTEGAPSARSGHAGVWTGQSLFIWGGLGGAGAEVALSDGALLVP
ncbi:hypothetical protein OV208_33385 [Corallococcus sp. bb12-1]|uniref:Kelch repeat-containing protein n=1 Tax=Corallococcus sp. bb12-1 TaxID=2996784 RepID=UPI0022722560|nr:hypothetical protein [Corallococcus sp. bb12-1]MCY1046251.1 hypothetical protein [Corallococcus sp. bb12-1]